MIKLLPLIRPPFQVGTGTVVSGTRTVQKYGTVPTWNNVETRDSLGDSTTLRQWGAPVPRLTTPVLPIRVKGTTTPLPINYNILTRYFRL